MRKQKITESLGAEHIHYLSSIRFKYKIYFQNLFDVDCVQKINFTSYIQSAIIRLGINIKLLTTIALNFFPFFRLLRTFLCIQIFSILNLLDCDKCEAIFGLRTDIECNKWAMIDYRKATRGERQKKMSKEWWEWTEEKMKGRRNGMERKREPYWSDYIILSMLISFIRIQRIP